MEWNEIHRSSKVKLVTSHVSDVEFVLQTVDVGVNNPSTFCTPQ